MIVMLINHLELGNNPVEINDFNINSFIFIINKISSDKCNRKIVRVQYTIVLYPSPSFSFFLSDRP